MLLILNGAEYHLEASRSGEVTLSEWEGEPGGFICTAEFEEE